MKGLMNKVKFPDITLKKIYCEKIEGIDDEKIGKAKRRVQYKVITNDSEKLRIELQVDDTYLGINCKVIFDLEYKVKEMIDPSEITPKNIIDILYPCSSIISMLNATISERIIGIPYIIQPYFDEEDFEQ